MDEIVSKNHITLTNSISFKQILVDSNKNSSLLKVKEIYYYNIVDYSEDNSIDTIVIPASYALGTAYIGSKAMAGL